MTDSDQDQHDGHDDVTAAPTEAGRGRTFARMGMIVVALVAVLGLGGLAWAEGRTDPAPGPGTDGVAAAALAVAGAHQPPPGVDPLEGLVVAPAPVAAPVPLPVPDRPPADAYAPTPEVRHGWLEIPAIGLRQPLFEGVTLTAINRGPSHWPGTAMPGELGNVVVAGHRTTYTRPFWDIQALEPGDELIFTMNDGSIHVYELDRLDVVAPTDVHIIDQTPEHTATLFACHPRGSARQRIVARFDLRPGQGAPTSNVSEAATAAPTGLSD